MKVLQILPSLDVGGVERGVIDLVRALQKEGVESVVISSGGELVAELQKLGVPHYTLPVHKKSPFSLFLISRIAEVIEHEHIDIVHARSRMPAWPAWFAARRTGVPFVTTCHGYYSNHFASRVMGWGKRVIVISQAIGRHMIDDFGVSPERIRLIHRGVDLSQFLFRDRSMDPPGGSPSRPFRIVNIGRFSPIKGQVEFLHAVSILRRQIKFVEVWLVGSEGRGKRKYTLLIEKTIRQLGLESCVHSLGTRRDIPELLAQSDLLVLSTLVPEAFGRVLIEAGAVGTPVVATRVGGILDVIDDGENGLLVPPGDRDLMAKAMSEILKNRERAGRFRSKLREKIEREFSLKQMVDQTLAVYREAASEKKILVAKLGATGDLILAVPSLRMIRKRFPRAWISLVVDKSLAPLVSHSPYIDEIIPSDRKRLPRFLYLLRLAKRIRREGFDLSVDLQNSKWTHALAFLAGIPERFGFQRGSFGFLLSRPDRTFHIADSPVRHQFRILSKLGVTELDETLELWPDPEAQNRISVSLDGGGNGEGQKLIGLVIGSSLKWPTKRWPADHFRELCGRLLQSLDCRIVLIGAASDAPLAENFSCFPPEKVMNLLGKTSLADLVALVKRLDVLVTGDTAPLHIAAAFQTRVVALFGPTDPKRHMPPVSNAIVLKRSLPCQPCYKGICHYREKLACMTRISVDEVFRAVERQLRTQPAELASKDSVALK